MQQLKSKTKESESAWKYWIDERKFTEKTADEFGIGYAPTSEFSLFDYLSQKNFKQEIMIKSGLFREKPRGGKLVSSFQDVG